MRKIIVTEFITLDGVVEAPGGNETGHPNGGWQLEYRHPEAGKYKVEELADADALLMGRNTFVFFSGYWPNQTGGGFADRINQLPKYVVSTTLQGSDWHNSHILRDVANDVAALKQTEGGDILVYGSATLAKSLLQHDLVDELHLLVCPVSVGGGLRLFDDQRELNKFGLKNTRVFDNGVLLLEYQPVHQNSN